MFEGPGGTVGVAVRVGKGGERACVAGEGYMGGGAGAAWVTLGLVWS